MERGVTGPRRVVKEMGGKMVRAEEEKWLRNANTREEWEEVLEVLASSEERDGLLPRNGPVY